MTQQQPSYVAAINLSFILRVATLVFFVLALIAGFQWGLTSWHWEGLTATGLCLWVASTLVP
jgi:hypothetical protein